MNLILQPSSGKRGFTLVEVILAIGISVGLLVVALVFYSQAANLRNQLLDEAEKISAIRLAMDRLSLELQTAFLAPQQGFVGNSDSLEFTTSAIVDPKVWSRPRTGRSEGPVTDLRLVSYRLAGSTDGGTNLVIAGLERTEEPLLIGSKKSQNAGLPEAAVFGGETNRMARTSTNSNMGVGTTNVLQSEFLNASIRQARFRYWDGSQWIDQWSQPTLPRAVEITFSPDPAPASEPASATGPSEKASASESDDQLYRRVVYLPGASTRQAAGGRGS